MDVSLISLRLVIVYAVFLIINYIFGTNKITAISVSFKDIEAKMPKLTTIYKHVKFPMLGLHSGHHHHHLGIGY